MLDTRRAGRTFTNVTFRQLKRLTLLWSTHIASHECFINWLTHSEHGTLSSEVKVKCALRRINAEQLQLYQYVSRSNVTRNEHRPCNPVSPCIKHQCVNALTQYLNVNPHVATHPAYADLHSHINLAHLRIYAFMLDTTRPHSTPAIGTAKINNFVWSIKSQYTVNSQICSFFNPRHWWINTLCRT